MKEYSLQERANLTFFGNMTNVDFKINELQSFLNEMHKHIEQTKIHLQEKKQNGNIDDITEDLSYHYNYTHSSMLRQSIIISLIMVLEAEIEVYCGTFQEKKELKVGYKDFRGDVLDRFKLYSNKVIGPSIDFNSRLWQYISGLYEIRNCLVHNQGSLENFGKRKVIENFVTLHKSFKITENEFIDITYEGCHESIDTINTFFEDLTSYALTVFPGSYKPIHKKPSKCQDDGF